MMPRRGKRILYVEDYNDAREVLPLLLPGYEVVTAANFDEGLCLALSQSFDLYLLDSWLPGGSGQELCRQIRGFDPHTPIVFYSSVPFDENRREAMVAGAQAYLPKPCDFEELAATISLLIGEEAK